MIERRRAVLVTFSVKTREFDSNYERNKFFRELYGWKQIVKKQEKRYIYRRQGLLDEMPHFRVDESVFVIAKQYMERMKRFLEGWDDKVDWDLFDVLLDEKQEEMLRGFDD